MKSTSRNFIRIMKKNVNTWAPNWVRSNWKGGQNMIRIVNILPNTRDWTISAKTLQKTLSELVHLTQQRIRIFKLSSRYQTKRSQFPIDLPPLWRQTVMKTLKMIKILLNSCRLSPQLQYHTTKSKSHYSSLRRLETRTARGTLALTSSRMPRWLRPEKFKKRQSLKLRLITSQKTIIVWSLQQWRLTSHKTSEGPHLCTKSVHLSLL